MEEENKQEGSNKTVTLIIIVLSFILVGFGIYFSMQALYNVEDIKKPETSSVYTGPVDADPKYKDGAKITYSNVGDKIRKLVKEKKENEEIVKEIGDILLENIPYYEYSNNSVKFVNNTYEYTYTYKDKDELIINENKKDSKYKNELKEGTKFIFLKDLSSVRIENTMYSLSKGDTKIEQYISKRVYEYYRDYIIKQNKLDLYQNSLQVKNNLLYSDICVGYEHYENAFYFTFNQVDIEKAGFFNLNEGTGECKSNKQTLSKLRYNKLTKGINYIG